MALTTIYPANSASRKRRDQLLQWAEREEKENKKLPSSWDRIRNMLACKWINGLQARAPSLKKPLSYSKMSSACSSLSSFRDVVLENAKFKHRSENYLGERRESRKKHKRMHLRRLSGCYECHTFVDSSRFSSVPATFHQCSECGEVVSTFERLEMHQTIMHAVYDLDPEDPSRNIVEIIFKSSWQKNQCVGFKIEKILKIRNSRRTVARFEEYRDAVRARASRSNKQNAGTGNPRCAADGNELLQFHCAKLTCALGVSGSSSMCRPGSECGVCGIIRHGFAEKVIRTTATSSAAHDALPAAPAEPRRAMLLCRVIAGRVRDRRQAAAAEGCDSVVVAAGLFSDVEELLVFNPTALLPCFIVIYQQFR